MEAMPDFRLLKPATVDEAADMARQHEGARFLAGGTDIIVNLRRGIGEASALIDLSAIESLNRIEAADGRLRIGAAVRLADIECDETVALSFPVLCQAAGAVAGPTHRRFATVGGNLCLDTRCIYYNQSHWWRQSNEYCLKYKGEICHVAPKSKICFAAFSGDLAPALLIHGAEVVVAGPAGQRRMALRDMYVEDGAAHLTLDGNEFVTAVELPASRLEWTGYQKVRVRDSIDFPLVGAAVGLNCRDGRLSGLALAFTGTNARPLLVEGLDDVCGNALDEDTLERVFRLANKQIQPMKSTFSPSTYRRSVAMKLAIHMIRDLWAQASD
ncbi:MAG: 4-hydroxybenzoyl-CoA reductase subunit beta [Hyphomicrobiales bacterium]